MSYHSVLFTASPKPGVSTMVSFSLTPFSSISTVCLVISTVCVIRSRETTQTDPLFNMLQGKYLSHKVKKNRKSFLTFSIEQLPIFVKICEKETVDQSGLSQTRLPFREWVRECEYDLRRYDKHFLQTTTVLTSNEDLPATMSVKSNPFLTDLRCTWFGSVAKPTYSLSWS